MLVEVATPFSTGTGVYLAHYDLIVTTEHAVRSNRQAVVEGAEVAEQLVPIVYLDPYYDLAFLRPARWTDRDPLVLAADDLLTEGTEVVREGVYRERIDRAEGVVTEPDFVHHGIRYLKHSALGEHVLPGSVVRDLRTGRVLGINAQQAPDGSQGVLALPEVLVREVLQDFARGEGRPGARCFHCQRITFEVAANPRGYCPHCREPLVLPSGVRVAEPTGIAATVEQILRAGGYDPLLARRGPDLWRIRQGSATIQITYHEDSGLVTGDAYLCQLPDTPRSELLAFLLRENDRLEQLTFSTYGKDIILSLLIYDRYLRVDTALPRFRALFAQADAYDDVLVDTYGAQWR